MEYLFKYLAQFSFEFTILLADMKEFLLYAGHEPSVGCMYHKYTSHSVECLSTLLIMLFPEKKKKNHHNVAQYISVFFMTSYFFVYPV